MSHDLIRQLNDTGLWWMIGKGRTRRNGPLFSCVLEEPRIDGRTLARAEGTDLADCVVRAILQLGAPAADPVTTGTTNNHEQG